MSKIIDDIVKTCNEIDVARNAAFAAENSAVKTTAETITGGAITPPVDEKEREINADD